MLAVIVLVVMAHLIVFSVWFGLRISTRAGSTDKEPPYAPPPFL